MFLRLSFFFLSASYACALWIPIRRQTTPVTAVIRNPQAVANVNFSDVANEVYLATIHVNGRPYQVQVDSGSSDLWIDAKSNDLPGVHHTGQSSTTVYGDGTSAGGEIVLGNVTFGEFTVVNQALVLAPGSNATDDGIVQGILGVGPYGGSMIQKKLNGTAYNGQNFLTNVFQLVPDESPFMTFLLSRTNTGVTEGGVLSIGELVSNLTHITKAPKLPVLSPSGWVTASDGVLVNGKHYSAHTTPTKAGNRSIALIDTGTSVGTLPRAVIDFMYKDISGAKWSEEDNTYKLPCQSKVNISLVFGGIAYPIHPIDAVLPDIGDNGVVTCMAAFEAADDGLMLLGDTFMRNVYTLFNFGDTLTQREGDEPAHIQLLSITDPDQAWSEYQQLNAKRIAELEYDKFAKEFQVASSTALSASATASQYTLVRHNSKVATTAYATATPTLQAAVQNPRRHYRVY
ncbi:aspartic peptidase domain-containing protein [Fomitopsis serialis]|uniref:aspartic peptidase domain-containing protein n=1 Tax=Fomitopsis serialis TaxID=139415 RepID=UPI002008A2B0|nr:aspartic peptidase domain-containing protein [Neoantrodia serialis]KAH9915321.1 aspartic peptidase domain-containing protein [Neoantrodia serialis]